MRTRLLLALLNVALVQSASAADFKIQGTQPAVVQPAAVPVVQPNTVPNVAVPNAATAGRPVVYQGLIKDQKSQNQQDSNSQNPMQQISPLLQQVMQGGGGGANSLSSGKNPSAGGPQYGGSSGIMSACSSDGSVPPSVMSAYHEAVDFRNKCAAAKRGDSQKIVISDFSENAAVPTMWIFDSNGNCLKKTAVTYGNGLGSVPPQGCSDDGSHLTPPGFHLTCMKGDGKYMTHTSPGKFSDDALGECSLEGQGTAERGVVIHRAANPGTASSFGCSGVCDTCFDEVKATLGLGALVYNYFGNRFAAGCKNKAGQSHAVSCQVEGANPPAEESAVPGTGESLQNGATTR